jgi:hypothetical protein
MDMGTLLPLLLQFLIFGNTYCNIVVAELEHISKHEVISSPLPTKELMRIGMIKTIIEDQDLCEIMEALLSDLTLQSSRGGSG